MGIAGGSKSRLGNLLRHNYRLRANSCGTRGRGVESGHLADTGSLLPGTYEAIVNQHVCFAGQQEEDVVVRTILPYQIGAGVELNDLSSIGERFGERLV